MLKEIYRLLEKDIEVFIGPIFTDKIIQVHEIVKEKNIPMITLSNNSILEELGISVFGLTLEDEIKTMLNYSIKKDLNKYAVIIPKNEYGRRVEKETEIFRSKIIYLLLNMYFTILNHQIFMIFQKKYQIMKKEN